MDWSQKYPNIAECIPIASKMVKKLRDNPNCELEARLGYFSNSKFKPGVNRILMDEIIESMQKSAFVSGDEIWKEETDVYFDVNNSNYRTRVQYDHINMTVCPETTQKNIISPSIDFIDMNENSDNTVVRMSLKTETIVENPPNSIQPYLVRIKQRRRFITENKVWAFDFSMTWSGGSRSQAEKSQMNDEPVFEIECELLDVEKYLQNSNEYVAASILLKMMDFLSPKTILKPY